MSNQQTIKALNQLLAAEGTSLVARLGEAGLVVPSSWALGHKLLDRMCAERRNHLSRLADLILSLHGAPVPGRPAVVTAGMHYVDLPSVAVALLTDLRQLVDTYRAVSLTGHPQADALITTIRAAHEDHLRQWEQWLTRAGQANQVGLSR